MIAAWKANWRATWREPARSAAALNWVQQLDFVGPRVRPAIWAWALLVLGLCALLDMADQAQQVQQALADASASLHRLQRAEHQQKVAATPVHSASSPDQAWSPEALQSAQGVVRLLAYPWADVLDKVEQAALQEQTLLLSFSLDQDQALAGAKAPVTIRLSAAVQTDESALRWARAHGEGAQLLARERLGTPAPSPQGEYPWRADVSWTGGAP